MRRTAKKMERMNGCFLRFCSFVARNDRNVLKNVKKNLVPRKEESCKALKA